MTGRRSIRTPIGLLSVYLSLTAAFALPKSTASRKKKCADVRGSFVIQQLALYPENADFDFERCLLYIGSLFNASVAVYDPYAKTTQVIEVPGVTHDPQYHLGGVAVNPYTSLLSMVVDAGAAFNTAGADISGTNLLILYDPDTKTELYRLNLTETTHGTYGGFQDVEFDSHGNVYVVGTFPSAILRIEGGPSKPLHGEKWKGTVTVNEWYNSLSFTASNVSGFGGLAMAKTPPGDEVLLVNDNVNHRIVRFDPSLPKAPLHPQPVPNSPAHPLPGSDAIYLPPKYSGTVLLAAVDPIGVTVLRSKNGKWETAEYLGTVSNNVTAAEGGMVPAVVQIGEGIFMVEEFFADPQPGTRTKFPMVDITDAVEALVKGNVKG